MDEIEEPVVVEDDSQSKTPVEKAKTSKARAILGMLFPQLTLRGEPLSVKRSVFIIFILYVSHSFSAWGDRMWSFVLSLFLVHLYPGSLLLPGVFGVMVQLTVAVFGTIVGDWVDNSPRIRVAWVSLLLQNGLLAVCSVVLALMFGLDLGVCDNEAVFGGLFPLVVILGAGANLASIANTISVEKDWIVVIANKQEDTLAVLNANMRRIDLCCKLLAPALTGVILQFTEPLATTIFVASWNILSFFAELSLLYVVYRMIPTLAIKVPRNTKTSSSPSAPAENSDSIDSDDNNAVVRENTDQDEETKMADISVQDDSDSENNASMPEEDDHSVVLPRNQRLSAKSKAIKMCSKLISPLVTLKQGWRIYIRQDIALVGFSMAAIYLTVLGFSGVTSAYLLTQGLRNDLIGLCQGVGAIFGVIGTIIYPFIRKRVGTIRTGLFGISTQLSILMFCVASVFVPSQRIESNAVDYYSPDCNASNYSNSSYVDPSYQETGSPAVILLLIGVLGCRIGLWTFDLAVQQLVQERVIESERGVVSGVMNAMNSIMDMLHYVLVIAAPRPEHFKWLTLLSVAMVTTGWVLYCAYVRKARGHFFHFKDIYFKTVEKCGKESNTNIRTVSGEDSEQLLTDTDEVT